MVPMRSICGKKKEKVIVKEKEASKLSKNVGGWSIGMLNIAKHVMKVQK